VFLRVDLNREPEGLPADVLCCRKRVIVTNEGSMMRLETERTIPISIKIVPSIRLLSNDEIIRAWQEMNLT
jgi:hypothetical protein